MPELLGATFSIKNNQDNYISLYPQTTMEQVIDFKLGEAYGPYVFELLSTGWVNNQQTFALNGITADDVPKCVKILEGTVEEMQAQQEAYNLLNPLTGVESLENQIRFTVTSVPTTTFKVQITWFR